MARKQTESIRKHITLDNNSFNLLSTFEDNLALNKSEIIRVATSLAAYFDISLPTDQNLSAKKKSLLVVFPKKLISKLNKVNYNRNLSLFVRRSLSFIKKLIDIDPFLYAALMTKVSSVEVAPLQVSFILKSPLRYEKLRRFLRIVKAREVGVGIYQCKLGSIFVSKLNEIRLQPSRENPLALIEEFRLFLNREGLSDKIYQIVLSLSFNGMDIGRGS
ncbi:MAG: hypothetical protein NDF54_06790 [archaeon GB-1867-035]|nr:hypothetical protein [Candidatus Culexmicrobium profundum]